MSGPPREGSGHGPTRRSFLQRVAGAVPGAAIAGSLGAGACAPDTGRSSSDGEGAGGDTGRRGAQEGPTSGRLPPETLRALAEVALPTNALGPDGTEAAVRGFEAWLDGFEAAAELDHPYLTDELRYGPPHPGPRWSAQLEAMDLESERRSGTRFAERGAEERLAIVTELVRREGTSGLPGDPALADGITVGLLAWFYGTSRANDLAYGAEIGRHLCRGVATLPDEPGPLSAG